tara:strand:- start:11 stop:292 length:282 start_codon:yes stop_codon:yes gene_type:complete
MWHQMCNISQIEWTETAMGDENTQTTHKLSNQALGSIMMALQESLLNELDIVPILKGFELVEGADGLMVTNPPTVRVSNEQKISEQDLLNMVE